MIQEICNNGRQGDGEAYQQRLKQRRLKKGNQDVLEEAGVILSLFMKLQKSGLKEENLTSEKCKEAFKVDSLNWHLELKVADSWETFAT